MVKIKKDVGKTVEELTPEELLKNTKEHIESVTSGLSFFSRMLLESGKNHDFTKLEYDEEFYDALVKGDLRTNDNNIWFQKHITEERHHLSNRVPDDVNLVDIFEYLVDCVMAGLARSGEVREVKIYDGVLQKAFQNTIELLKINTEVSESNNVLDQFME